VIVAVGVLALMLGGILSSLVQMRRQAAASVAQNSALTIVQGYIEQIKNIPLQQFVNSDPFDQQNNPRLTVSFALPTRKDQSALLVQLRTTPSTVALSTLTGARPGVTPTGVVDNLQSFDMDSRLIPGTVVGYAVRLALAPGQTVAHVAVPGISRLSISKDCRLSTTPVGVTPGLAPVSVDSATVEGVVRNWTNNAD
jgi:type II secretory pathway pseudopilin PulG